MSMSAPCLIRISTKFHWLVHAANASGYSPVQNAKRSAGEVNDKSRSACDRRIATPTVVARRAANNDNQTGKAEHKVSARRGMVQKSIDTERRVVTI